MSNFVKHNVYLPGSNRCVKMPGGVRVGTSFNEGNHNSDIVVQSTNCPVNLIIDAQNNSVLENASVISDLTDIIENNNTVSSDTNLTQNIDKLLSKTKENLNKLNVDALKDKCKEHLINGIYKLKKTDLIQLLINEYNKLASLLNVKKNNELRNICKQYKLKFNMSSKKESLIFIILDYCSGALKFNIDLDGSNITETPTQPTKIPNQPIETQKQPIETPTATNQCMIDILEKQRQEIETKMKEEIEKQKKIEEDELKKKQEEEKKKEKEESKKKKQSIPKQVRSIVWNHYIGEDIIKHKCLCCKKVTITNTNFDVGHVLSEKNGGTHEINNLRPICGACNHSMGSENMVDFVIKYGLYIG